MNEQTRMTTAKILLVLLTLIVVGYLIIHNRRSVASSTEFTEAGLAYTVGPISRWSWFKHYYIEVINADTDLIMRFESPDPISYLSPTGDHLAYINKDGGILLLDVGGTQPPTQVWPDQAWSKIWWSADGRNLAWEIQQGFMVYRIDQKRIIHLNLDTAFPTALAWSPTTSSLAIANQRGVHLFTLATGKLNLTLPSTETYVYTGLAWSPDEQQLVMQLNSAESYYLSQGLAIVDADGTNFLQLTSNPSDSFPTWSPDGQSIAFVRGDLLLMSLSDLKSPQYLTRGEYINEPFVWYPDNKHIAFTSVRRDECRTVKSIIPQDFAYVYCPETLKLVDTMEKTVTDLHKPKDASFWNLMWLSAPRAGYEQ